MKFIVPVPITQSMLSFSNISEPSVENIETITGIITLTPPVWSSTTSYLVDDYVIMTTDVHKIYQCLVANTGSQPNLNLTGAGANWIEISSTNRWRMFDNYGSTQSRSAALSGSTYSLQVTINLNADINSLALVNISGATNISITCNLSSMVTYSYSGSIAGKTDVVFYELVGQSGGSLNVVLSGLKPIKCGKFEIGNYFELGDINYGSSVGIIDYSKKLTDPFGNITLEKRAFTKRISAKVIVKNNRLDGVDNMLSAYRATAVVWDGADNLYTAFIVYGFYRDFDLNIAYPLESDCTLTIEGINDEAVS